MAEFNIEPVRNLSPELQKAFSASVKAETVPIRQVEDRKEQVQERLKLLDDIIQRVEGVRSLLPELSSPFAIKELAVSSGDDKIITAIADKREADYGKYTFEVAELAKSARAMSNRFPDKDETRIGSGYFVFENRDGEEQEVFIDNENSTLDGIARVINQANMGMKASVVRDEADLDAPYRLVLSAENTGASETVEYPEFYFIDGEEDFYIDEELPATNARIKYDGFEIETPSNEVKDLIRGVTVNLKGLTREGTTVSLSIEQDIPATTEKIKKLVENTNKVLSFIQEQNSLDEKSDTFRTLGGDYGMRLSEGRIRDALRENLISREGANIQTLADIGIQFNKKGTLDLDEKKLKFALETHYDGVVDLLAGDGQVTGVITKLSTAMRSLTVPGTGLLTNQRQNYQQQVSKFDREIADKTQRAEEKLERLKGTLASAQVAINRMRGQTGFFAGQADPMLEQALANNPAS